MNKLALQSTCFDNIKTLCTNYNKDSKSRKTQEYLNKRLSSLEAQWMDFNARHSLLLQEIEDKNINYFTEEVYSKTKTMYETTKADILKMLQTTEENVKFDLTDLSGEPDEKTKTLLTKQECNFKAIDRAMAKIDVEAIAEKWELDDHLSILKSKWDAIDKTHWELEAILKGSNSNYNNMFVTTEEKYDELRKTLSRKIWSTAHYERSAPKIEVPEFSGNYTQWISFKDLFMETIHNNPMINKAQKMQHLKTRLRGEAERLVQHLSISAENYTSCWEILTQRFDNRRLQCTSFLNTMLNLPVIQQPDGFNLKKMHDVITECMNGLANIGLDIATWDPIIVHLMSQKLDTTSYGEYIKELRDPRDVPNLNELLDFLENKFMAYETMKNTKKEAPNHRQEVATRAFNKHHPAKLHNYEQQKSFKRTYHTAYGHCPNCDGNHVLMNCPKFINMDSFQRNDTVSKLHVCENCLYSHGNTNCASSKTCKECNRKHHTLLHNADMRNNSNSSNTERNNNNPGQRLSTSTSKQTSNHVSTNEMEILLTTVQLKIKSANGEYMTLRALLDQGSQVNLITENAAQMLRLPRKRLNATITGVGAAPGSCKGRLQLTCKSIHSDYAFETQALILSKLTNNLPNSSFEKANWPHIENLKLADPEFNVSSPIDLLLGADVYSDIILDGVLKGSQQSPVAQQTHLGWILCGKLKTLNCHMTLVDLSELTKFWENEDITSSNHDMMPKDDQCEEYYSKTVQRDASRWDRYVSNRVDKIKQVIPSDKWRYVKSAQNPADCAYKGMMPSKLMNFELWWKGPDFLIREEDSDLMQNSTCLFTTNQERINLAAATLEEVSKNNEHFINILLHKHSSLMQVIRVTAQVLRFIATARSKLKPETTYLTFSELKLAADRIITYAQTTELQNECKQLKANGTVHNKSTIYKLNPYMDEKGIIRVGGRLTNSDLPFEMKHPIILPRKGRLTQLIIEQAHLTTLHGGARLTLAQIRQRYWIVGSNRAVKTQLRHCVRCHRYKPTDSYQLMADLPQQRATPSRPFTHTGVDFTGHVHVKLNKGRGVKTTKGYIAVFVCMATKAVHIELVSDLSTETFIAAFQRMCARRGTPQHVYSDCGTNFIGASKMLRNEYQQFQQELSPVFFNEIGKMEVEWHFNAPAWPSAGGLWEAAVKSMKHHLHRVLGDQKLTFEEFTTLLAKIEACMNSRPLCPLTEDPEEFQNYLTPGHFLTGSPTMSLPISSHSDERYVNLRQRWQLTEHMLHQFWKSWSSDYLTQLQTRGKWNKPKKNIQEGDIVLIKDNNLPPGKWAMGRVLELHPGSDGYVRVTTVKTQTGIIKRPIVKLSPLPINTMDNESDEDCKTELQKHDGTEKP